MVTKYYLIIVQNAENLRVHREPNFADIVDTIGMTNKMAGVNKNYMSIAVSVLTTSQVARNSGGAARQENRPQSATAYSSVR